MGYGSRSEIRNYARKGVIKVNGKISKDSGIQVDPERDEIIIHDQLLMYRAHIYLMMNKPPGVISATEDRIERTVIDVLHEPYTAYSLFPVGRLDKDTEGLLLLTNDGKLAHQLLSPRKHVPKTYLVHVQWEIDEASQKALETGIQLDDGYVSLPAQLRMLVQGNHKSQEVSVVELTIFEGKYHQVKRMFEALGQQVVYLRRISMGPLILDPNLPLGKFRELTELELDALNHYITPY